MTKGKRLFKTWESADRYCKKAISYGFVSSINCVGSRTFVVEVE